VRGGFSRSTGNPQARLAYLLPGPTTGDTKLNYPLFGRFGTDTFDQIDLRTSENYSWSFGGDGNNTFLREEGSRLTQTDMGDLGSHVRYVHVYVTANTSAFSIRRTQPRPASARTICPAGKDDFDVVKCEQDSGYTIGVTDGNLTALDRSMDKSRAHYFSPTNANYFKMQGRLPTGSPRPLTPFCSMWTISSTT